VRFNEVAINRSGESSRITAMPTWRFQQPSVRSRHLRRLAQVSVAEGGSFTVTNGRTGFTTSYK
jgi:hypothetical protein